MSLLTVAQWLNAANNYDYLTCATAYSEVVPFRQTRVRQLVPKVKMFLEALGAAVDPKKIYISLKGCTPAEEPPYDWVFFHDQQQENVLYMFSSQIGGDPLSENPKLAYHTLEGEWLEVTNITSWVELLNYLKNTLHKSHDTHNL